MTGSTAFTHGGRRPGAGRRRGALRVSVTVRVLPETARHLGAAAFLVDATKGQLLDVVAELLVQLAQEGSHATERV